jgi:hypothetical protein
MRREMGWDIVLKLNHIPINVKKCKEVNLNTPWLDSQFKCWNPMTMDSIFGTKLNITKPFL